MDNNSEYNQKYQRHLRSFGPQLELLLCFGNFFLCSFRFFASRLHLFSNRNECVPCFSCFFYCRVSCVLWEATDSWLWAIRIYSTRSMWWGQIWTAFEVFEPVGLYGALTRTPFSEKLSSLYQMYGIDHNYRMIFHLLIFLCQLFRYHSIACEVLTVEFAVPNNCFHGRICSSYPAYCTPYCLRHHSCQMYLWLYIPAIFYESAWILAGSRKGFHESWYTSHCTVFNYSGATWDILA